MQNNKIFSYLGILFFANPEIVAKANIPNSAIPRNNPASWLTPAPTATSDSILVAVGAGVSQGAGLFLGIALLGMFALATISGLAKNKMPK